MTTNSPEYGELRLNELLQVVSKGDRGAAEALFPYIYDELRVLAQRYLLRERVGHTLQPTALVHEAYLKLSGHKSPNLADESHFKAIAARAMRQILVDHARAKKSEKRGGDAQRVTLNENLQGAEDRTIDILILDQMLTKLEMEHQRMCLGVELRFFSGMSESEIAEVLGVSERTVRGDWSVAKLWLNRELTKD